jgi:hypothetical protein
VFASAGEERAIRLGLFASMPFDSWRWNWRSGRIQCGRLGGRLGEGSSQVQLVSVHQCPEQNGKQTNDVPFIGVLALSSDGFEVE